MKTVVDKANTRGYANHGWLKTHHTFSFANYYNQKRVHFGMLRVLNDDSIAYQTVHSHYTYTLGIKDHPKSHSTGVIHPDRYNVFAVEMYPDSLSFYVNDIHTFTYPRIQTQKEGQFPFDQPFYLLIDMQLGGSWVGAVDPKDLPVEMEVDWVRFYQRKSLK